MRGDRTLHYFSENALQFIADIAMVGFDDLEELNRKIAGLRNEIDQLEVRACAIAGEQAERRDEPRNEPYDSGWVASFNAGRS